jgi:hypothetical protein
MRMRQNVLLPNGDVTLCCMDYGLQHLLGNLVSGDYDALLRSDEFLRVRKGLKDESEEILCRYCEAFAYHVNPLAGIADRALEKLLELRRPAEIVRLRRRFLARRPPHPTDMARQPRGDSAQVEIA